jgi:hypothetical protein
MVAERGYSAQRAWADRDRRARHAVASRLKPVSGAAQGARRRRAACGNRQHLNELARLLIVHIQVIGIPGLLF